VHTHAQNSEAIFSINRIMVLTEIPQIPPMVMGRNTSSTNRISGKQNEITVVRASTTVDYLKVIMYVIPTYYAHAKICHVKDLKLGERS
jgi:hypothetical protein